MTDDFDRLTHGLRAGPAPDPAARAAALRLAMENFDRLHQGTAQATRPNLEGHGGLWIGAKRMFDRLTSRPALAATTSVAALCLGVVITLPMLQNGPQTGGLSDAVTTIPEMVAPQKPAPRPATLPADARAQQPETAATTATRDALAQTAPEPAPTVPPVIVGDDAGIVVTELAEADAPAGAAVRQRSPVTAVGRAEAKRELRLGITAERAAPPPPAVAAPAQDMLSAAAPEMLVAPDPVLQAEPDTEAFPGFDANPVKVTAEAPVSTFSIDVDTASYAVVRSSLNAGVLPPPEAVRIEEMVNYFPYALPAPGAEDPAPFKPTVTVMPTPWNDGTRLVQIALQGTLPALDDRPPLNLVFLIDTSGSMEDPSKLPLLKQSLALILPQLRQGDQVAMVAYAGSAGEVLAPTDGQDRATILLALDRLAAGGSTAGAEGLALAYQVADRMAAEGEVSRILLATDGDFNVGVSDPDGLEAYVAKKRETGTYLSILGFGRGNLDDAVMQAMAQAGNGTAAYIDTAQEARKVLVDQLSGALFPIADDVKIQVEWNPATVAEYRLIGYETRALAREDFNNDRVDAGEIGAGTAVTALYEITAPDSPARATDPLRYGDAAAGDPTGELGFLRLRWKAPGAADSVLLEVPIRPDMAPIGPEARFAAAIAGFGQLLTGAKYLGDWGWNEAIALALQGRGDDPFGYRAEAVNLMRLAQALSQ